MGLFLGSVERLYLMLADIRLRGPLAVVLKSWERGLYWQGIVRLR